MISPLKDVRSIGFSIALLLGILMLSSKVNASTYVDPLADWSNVLGHSDNLRIDTKSTSLLGPSRATRIYSEQDGMFWYKADARSFSANVYYYDHYQSILVFSSPDGQSWSQAETTITGPPPTASNRDPNAASHTSGWGADIMSGTFPTGTQYVMFVIKKNGPNDSGPGWAPEVGEIRMSTNTIANFGNDLTPSPNGPQGLTVLAASGEAYLNWYPLKGATSYTIKRSSDYSDNYASMASNVKATIYDDLGLSKGTRYNYAVLANMPDGTTLCSQIIPVTPDNGAVVFSDPLTDWSNVNTHTDGLGFSKEVGDVVAVRRTTADTESLTYNLPGSVKFAANVYFLGDLSSQLSAEASMDNVNWVPVKITNTPPVNVGFNWSLSVVSAVGQLPENTNYVRINLQGDGFVDSPQVGAVRMTYGATKLTHMVMRPSIGSSTVRTASAEEDGGVLDSAPWNIPSFHAAVLSTVSSPQTASRGYFWILRYKRGDDTVYVGSLVPVTYHVGPRQTQASGTPGAQPESTEAEFSYNKTGRYWFASISPEDGSKPTSLNVPNSYFKPVPGTNQQMANGATSVAGGPTANNGSSDTSSQTAANGGSNESDQTLNSGGSVMVPQTTSDGSSGASSQTGGDGSSGASSQTGDGGNSGAAQPSANNDDSDGSNHTVRIGNSGTEQPASDNSGPSEPVAGKRSWGASRQTADDGDSNAQQQQPTDGAP